MVEKETERKARVAGEEVTRLRKVLEAIRNGTVPSNYRVLKPNSRVENYLEGKFSDV